MEIDFNGNSLQDIAALVGGLIALGLALQAAIGPTVMYLTEAVKDAFKVRSGMGGLLATCIGMVLGFSLGLLTAITTGTDSSGYFSLSLIGLFAGLFMGAGAINSHKAAGTVNTDTAAAVQLSKDAKSSALIENYAEGYNEAVRTMAYTPDSNLMDADEPFRGPKIDLPEAEDPEDDLAEIIFAGPVEDPINQQPSPKYETA